MAAVADYVEFRSGSGTLILLVHGAEEPSYKVHYVLSEGDLKALTDDIRKARRQAQRADMDAEYDDTNRAGW